jgi:hypothetical protein
MRKEWILTDEEKRLKRRKIERNRLIKEQAQLAIRQQHNDSNFRTNNSSSSTIEVCHYFRLIIPIRLEKK